MSDSSQTLSCSVYIIIDNTGCLKGMLTHIQNFTYNKLIPE